MPFKKRISEVEQSIETVLGSIAAMREKGADATTMEPLLGQLARLKAERLRLMEHQGSISN
jgi:hypothetical protein